MRWIAIVLVALAACTTPCEGQRTVAEGFVGADQLKPELAKCAGQTVCVAPCIDLFTLTADDQIETCKVTIDSMGGAKVEARYIDRSVCGTNDVIDGAGDVVVDDGSWADWGGDDSTDDGSSDGSTDDGSSDDGSSDDGSSDDGSGDDGSGDALRSPSRPVHQHVLSPATSR